MLQQNAQMSDSRIQQDTFLEEGEDEGPNRGRNGGSCLIRRPQRWGREAETPSGEAQDSEVGDLGLTAGLTKLYDLS